VCHQQHTPSNFLSNNTAGDSRHIIIFNNSRSTFKTTINQAANGQSGPLLQSGLALSAFSMQKAGSE
jgi:hypothetical protein